MHTEYISVSRNTLEKLMYSYCVEEYVTREMFTIVK